MENNSIETLSKKICQTISLHDNRISIKDFKIILSESIHTIDIDEELKKLNITLVDLINFLESHNMIGDVKNSCDINKMTFRYTPSFLTTKLSLKLANTAERTNNNVVENYQVSKYEGSKSNVFSCNKLNNVCILKKKEVSIFEEKNLLLKKKEIKNITALKNYDDFIKSLEEKSYEYQASETIQNQNEWIITNLLVNKMTKFSSKSFLKFHYNYLDSKKDFKNCEFRGTNKNGFSYDSFGYNFNLEDNDFFSKKIESNCQYFSTPSTIDAKINNKENKNCNKNKRKFLNKRSMKSIVSQSFSSDKKLVLVEAPLLLPRQKNNIETIYFKSSLSKIKSTS
ncbi:Hypothetical protein SRAE_1000349900 [Strongyloides ratti]|uniref:Winged helix-turn-helix DNA-binding domain-containing protein n=1 Tax=Strongyloides ratti TaxID=34506 RepID=A0A090L642_STRRB|nr:Hypothetical protein SRAE_1000349900 [Strongyloides ratti]CEF65246.1 Hypothetical protein SRAE_1000349900 [Strongyloides ratti]